MLIKIQCCSMTRLFYTVSSSGMSCKFCGKAFNRGFNLQRHENGDCPLKSKLKEREMSETESLTAGPEDDASSVATEGSQSSMTGDSETEEEEADPWMPMVEKAMQKHKAAFQEMKMTQSGLDEETAGETAYSNILPELQKELESIYLQRLQWIQQLKKDPVHNKIMQTKNALANDDDFDPEEAMEAAVNKRKFLIKRRLKDYSFTEDSDNEEDYYHYINICHVVLSRGDGGAI